MSQSVAIPGREWSLLLAACSSLPDDLKRSRIRAALSQPVCWKSLFELAHQNGAQPLLYHSLVSLENEVPREQMLALRQLYQANLHKSLILSRELFRILDALSSLNIEALPYKGLALAEMAFEDIALRQSGDIDLLIRPQDLARVRIAVGELGYTPHVALSEAQERAYLESGYECAFDTATNRNLLEVQWAIQPRFYAVDFDMNGLFRRAVPINVAGRDMRTPSPEDQFVILSLHAAKHLWDRLIWLCDIARIMNRQDINWNSIADQAQELGVARILRVTMLLANRMLDAPIPSAADAILPQDPGASAIAGRIGATDAAKPAPESLSYFRLTMQLRERSIDRMRFLSRLAFTPGPGEWDVIPLPRLLFPLYRLVRLARLAARLTRAS